MLREASTDGLKLPSGRRAWENCSNEELLALLGLKNMQSAHRAYCSVRCARRADAPPRPKEKVQPKQVRTRNLPDPMSPAFLESFEWRQLRMVVLRKYGARCQCCGASPATGAVMNVDHIKPRKLFPHLALDEDNLQVLCHECNHGKGNWDQTDWRPEEVDPAVVSLLKDIARHG